MNAGFRYLVLVAIAFVATCGVSRGQTNYFFRPTNIPNEAPPLPGGPGLDGNWFTEEDGNPEVSGGTNWYDINFQSFIPAYDYPPNGERAFIENGGTAFVDSAGPYSPGQVVLGSTSGTSGTLEIRSGGVLASRIGPATNGNITVGSSAGIGVLRVLPGGTLSAESSLVQGTNDGNLIRVGGPTGAAASLTAATANLGSNLQIYPNATVSTTGGGNFGGGVVYTSEVTGNGSNGKINIGATAAIGGDLVLNFSGYTPSVGHNWNVLEAAAINGNFASVTSNATLAANHALVATKPSLGGGRVGYNVGVQEVLVLEVSRDTGMATLKHPGSSNIVLDGYFIGSDAGSLKSGSWSSFDAGNQFGGDWLATAARPDNLAELKPAGDATLNGGNTLNYQFGNIYDAFAGPFGTVNEDLEFRYRRSSDGTQFPGKVVYTGTKFNTLLLQVDPTGTGDAFLRNTSDTTVQIDSYDVLSEAGRLSTSGWNSFDEQNYEGANTWLEVASNANQIGEVNQAGFTMLAPGAALNLGKLYTGGAQDLALSFLLQGQETATPGHVLYEAFSNIPVPGDYNGNGVVDAADYTRWRDNLGAANESGINNNGDGGGVTANDYTFWKQRFGNTAGSGAGGLESAGAVPEPGTLILIVGMATALACGRRKS